MDWIIDVWVADPDDWKGTGQGATRVRLCVSHVDFPSWGSALDVAACMAVALRGGMPVHHMRVR